MRAVTEGFGVRPFCRSLSATVQGSFLWHQVVVITGALWSAGEAAVLLPKQQASRKGE